MSRIKTSDFYYGAVLSMLFNNHINPAILESNDDRQVYDLTTNSGDFRLFIKYRANSQNTKTPGYNSWTFSLTESDKEEIVQYIGEGRNLVLALVCGLSNISEGELALLDKVQTQKIIDLNRTAITVTRKKHERAFRILIGGGREHALRARTNRFNDLFVKQ